MEKKRSQMIIKYMIMIAIILFSTILFYNIYPNSDISVHAVIAEIMTGVDNIGLIKWCSSYYVYPVWHLAYLCILKCMLPIKNFIMEQNIDYSALCASITCALGIMGIYLTSSYVYAKVITKRYEKYTYILAVFLIFTGPYYVKAINDSYYLGQGIVVPWHNPTTIAVYPLAMLCFGLYYVLAQKAVDKQDLKIWITFSCLLFISGFAKPSFYQMFIPGMAVFCLLELIFTRGRRIVFGICSFVAVLPTCILILVQHFVMIEKPTAAVEAALQSTSEVVVNTVSEPVSEIAIAGIGIGWLKVQSLYSAHPIQSLLLMWIFPIFVIMLYALDKKRNIKMSLPLSCTLSGLLQYVFFYLQMRPKTGDFAWGYYLSLSILFVGSVSYFLELCETKKWKFLKWFGIMLYLGHVIFGLIYALKLTNPDFIYYAPLF